MGNTWITDMRHFLDASGNIANMPVPARRLAHYLGSIVTSATSKEPGITSKTQVKCRRRPRRRPCPGQIITLLKMDSKEIIWKCPNCGDNGVIRNWEGTLWDCTTRGKSH